MLNGSRASCVDARSTSAPLWAGRKRALSEKGGGPVPAGYGYCRGESGERSRRMQCDNEPGLTGGATALGREGM